MSPMPARPAATIGATALVGITPSAASASASAASNASIAATIERSAKTSTIAALASVRAKIAAVIAAPRSQAGAFLRHRLRRQRAGEDLVDALAVEVDDLEAPAFP